MKIIHSSDLHGGYKRLLRLLKEAEYDVWLDTGDFFPDEGEGYDSTIAFQISEADLICPAIVEALAGRPLISVSGNHDFISLAEQIRKYGGVAYSVQEGPVEFGGEVFAGFREIPWIRGDWVGEVHDLRPMTEQALEQNPTILLIHAPPNGILTDGHEGNVPLTSALMYGEHRIKACLFGHAHHDGGQEVERGGIRFFNGARHTKIHRI